MISSNFSFGEQSKIASAYAAIYAPSSLNESCDCRKKEAKKDEIAKKGAIKHNAPKGTGSKLGRRPMMPLKKRDAKSSAKKFAPKAKVVESSPITSGYCIVDGEKTLCTSDIGESYFSKDGIIGETRIYESAIAAMKDIKKVNSRRKADKKYCIKKCECVGESFQFTAPKSMVNEGLWDGLKSIGSGIVDGAKAVGNAAGGTLKAAGNLAQGNFSQAGSDFVGGLKDAGNNVLDAGKNIGGGALNATVGTAADTLNAAGGLAKAGGNALQGNFSQAGEELKSAGTEALRAVGGDDAAEADVAGAVKNAGSAIANGAVEGAKALGNTAMVAGNSVGGVLKGVGNLAQGNPSQALADFKDGVGKAFDSAKAAGNNVVNAATNTNDEQKKKEAEAAANASKPLTQDQQQAVANGAVGPISDEAAKKQNAEAAAAAAKDPKAQVQKTVDDAMNQVNQFMPDSVKQAMQAGFKAPTAAVQQNQAKPNGQAAQQQGQQPAQQSQPAQQGGQQQQTQQGAQGNAAKKAELQKQIAELQKQLQALG